MAKRVLSVSYDLPLLQTRHFLLERGGFDVVSAWGFSDSMEALSNHHFDLFVLGHSIPQKDKSKLIAAARTHTECKVLSIRRHGDLPPADADASVDADDGPI